MAIRIYNTLSRKKETFEPINPGKVKMYVCGPTVYDYIHIGNARAAVVFDTVARYFRKRDYDVTYVRNFTDVEDKIIKKAQDMNISSESVASKFIDTFYQDMDRLNVEKPDFEPKVTDYIPQIVNFIDAIIKKGYAYNIDGDVFFSVGDYKDYGKLSGRKIEDMEAGARVEIDERKKSPFDFALWKKSKPNEPAWDSPWGKGRPGWHIECSAMSGSILGESFDIHGGGKDLIFPHHENEIAQSESVYGKPFAKYWIHNGFVNINSEKMSKSLGNFIIINDIIQKYHPEAVRLFLLSNHYRTPLDYSEKAMEQAVASLDKLYALFKRAEDQLGTLDLQGDGNSDYWKKFCIAMDDDFNTATGFAVIFEAARDINSKLDSKPDKNTKEIIIRGLYDIKKIATDILGILTLNPNDYFEYKKSMALDKMPIDSDEIENMIEKRTQARKSKDWALADKIRKQLEDMDIIIEDRPDGTLWKVK